MPVYMYRCVRCGALFDELFLSFEAAGSAQAHCPKCGGSGRRTYAGNTFHTAGVSTDALLLEDSEPYRRMHYHERRGEWEQAAKAAEGVSEFARGKFLQKAEQKEPPPKG